ncbi:MAG: hypothetical protein AB7I19_04485 [Planctomycetota bacterium]
MQTLLRRIAELLGIDVAPDAELRFAFAGFPSGGLGLLVLLGIALALAAVVAIYRRDAHGLSRPRRLTLAGLRMLAIAAVCLLLLDPQIVTIRRETRPGETIVLVDGSQSMAQVDGYRHPSAGTIADRWRAAGIAEPGKQSRLQLARHLLTRNDDDFLRRLSTRNRVSVHGFGAGLETLLELPLRSTMDPTAPATSAPSFDATKLRAEGSYTNLGGAIREALGRDGTDNLAGIVILTDGRRNLGPPAAEVARLLGLRAVPRTIVVPIGDPTPLRTMKIRRVDAPERVFKKDPFTIRAFLEGRGYEQTEVTVRLVRKGDDANATGEVIRTQTVTLDAARAESEVVFAPLTSEQPGHMTYSVEVDPPQFEDFSAERHRSDSRIETLAEKTRVLLISGGPTHEYRILRNLLVRDQTIEVACWLSSAAAGFAQEGNVSLTALPTTAVEFATWDVFVLLDPDPATFDTATWKLLAEQVREKGSGLLWSCGEKFTLEALRDDSAAKPVVDLLPIEPDLEAAEASIGLARGMPQPWPYELTAAGRQHPAAMIAEERGESEAIWSRLPGFYFAFPIVRAKPAAQVLVEHRKPISGDDPDSRHPLIATQFVGSGRSLLFATDDTRLWRTVFESAYDRLWVRSIRFLFEGKVAAGNARLRLAADQERIELGGVVRVTAEVRAEDFEPSSAPTFEVEWTGPDGTASTLTLAAVEGAPGRFEAFLRPTALGMFRLGPKEPLAGRPVIAGFQVVAAALEKEGPSDLDELAILAGVPGGLLVTEPDRLADALDTVESKTRIESFTSSNAVWDSMWTIGLLVLLLSTEWWLRKRFNLL